MNKWFTILLFFLISCSTKKVDLVGKYESDSLSILQKLYYFNNSNIKGLALTLFKDNTFHYDACGLIFDGKWATKKDTIFLTVIKHKWKSEKIEKANKTFNQKNNPNFFIYEIKNGYLISIIKRVNKTDIIKLKKIT